MIIHERQTFGGGEPGNERLGSVADDAAVGWTVMCETVLCETGGGEPVVNETGGGEPRGKAGETGESSCGGSMS